MRKSNRSEVILLSRNDPDTGLRVFNSIEHYGLDITRAAFVSGRRPYRYIAVYGASLFLSANEHDVKEAIVAGYPAGRVLESTFAEDQDDQELRIAFDFDGVIVDDEAEKVYHETGDISQFHAAEVDKALMPHTPGPMKELLSQRLRKSR